MNRTRINWTTFSWNPFSGCDEVSEGCKFCYAKTSAERKRGTKAFPNGFDLTVRPHKLREPYRLKGASLVFVNSTSDLFLPDVPESYRDQIFEVMRATPQHQYQVLTKRPELMRDYSRVHPFPSNVWAGVSIEANRHVGRADVLRDVDGAVKFISAEPLLSALPDLDLHGVHWLISGGESGSHLSDESTRERRGLVDRVRVKTERGMRWKTVPSERGVQWVRQLRDKCVTSGAAYFHKQWGGGTSKSGGRLLDGRTWDEFPRARIDGAWVDTVRL